MRLNFLLILLFSSLVLASPETQQYTYAPFSGAIYIVSPNGQQINTEATGMCPSYASESCSSIGQPSWCCPTSFTCAIPASSGGLIGCCPTGSTCSGSINAEAITTITVQSYITSTISPVYVQHTSVVYVQATTVAPVYVAHTSAAVVYNGYCSTLVESGPGLPTTRQGDCGTILIVNAGRILGPGVGIGLGVLVGAGYFVAGRMFGAGVW
ncbi:hypothetical protein K432DRAFT_95949 [Lepidopterella palustris CBS 459.81]|uniref:Uncharacterized protein n=1 Tax=Lepidopterella palustris CBS 459.81 TaxID=1314670 RepID=A0A8E2JDC8_9PEZI|nr:hypothetical protein K432DRAFT_95949 [Lepidopterella palustris CBS 459.81]